MSIISVISAFAVFGSSSVWANSDTMAIPFILVLILSAVSFKKRDSDFDGIIVVVTAAGPDAMETTIEPSFPAPSDTDTKYPLVNFKICKEKLRPSKAMAFCENPSGELNEL